MKCSCWMIHYNLSRSHRVKLATTSPGSTIQTGLLHHSRQLVCVCVWLHMRGLLTTPLPSILITPCLAFVHVSPLPVRNLLPCYTSWQTDECSFDSFIASNLHRITSLVTHTNRQTHTHTDRQTHEHGQTDTHLSDLTESLSLYLKFNGPECNSLQIQRWHKHS